MATQSVPPPSYKITQEQFHELMEIQWGLEGLAGLLDGQEQVEGMKIAGLIKPLAENLYRLNEEMADLRRSNEK
jgi:hypothetical protein